MKSLRVLIPVTLVCLSASACVTWTSVHTPIDAIDQPANDDCETLHRAAKDRGLEIHVQTDEDHFPSMVLPVGETLILRPKAEHIVRGRWWVVGREIPRVARVALECPDLGERELEVRTCSDPGRRWAVVDASTTANWLGAGTPTKPCTLLVTYELRREREFTRTSVVVRRSIRPWLENSR